jgi:hypothetical protein
MTITPPLPPPAPPSDTWAPPPGTWIPEGKPAGQKSHRWRWIGIGAAGAIALIIAILMVIGFVVASSSTLVSSNFNNRTGPFVAESDPYVSLSYVDGGYSTHLNAGSPPQIARVWFDRGSVHGLRYTIDATVRSSTGDFAWGIGVWNGATAQYLLMTSNQGGSALGKEADATTGDRTMLATSEQPAYAPHVHFVLEIKPSTHGATLISGRVNGVPIRGTDINGFHSFSGVGLWISGSDQPIDILWDNMAVTQLGE